MADNKTNRGFAKNRKAASMAGKKGAQAQSTDAKRRGGENSQKDEE